jgi:outer membrane protein
MKPQSKMLAMVLFAYNVSSYALPDLLDVYQQALANDPTFKQAYGTYMSDKEAVPQAISAILPNLSAQSSYSLINVDAHQNTIVAGGATLGYTVQSYYNNRSYTVNLKQPVLNFQYWHNISQANYSARSALATYNSAAQSLMQRTSSAYFAVLKAKDDVKYNLSQLRANGRSLEQAKQRFKVGLDAITSVYEAQAAYDSSRSLVIQAKNNLTNQYENLRLLTNHTYQGLAPLKGAHVPLIKPEPVNIDDWTDRALHQNYALKAAQYTAFASKENIKSQNSGHMPYMDLSLTFNHSDTRSGFVPLKSKTNTGTAALTLNLPVYQGGLVVSKTRQASYQYQANRAAYEKTYRTTIVDTRKAFNNIIDGISKIQADRQAVKSAQNSLESTDAQFKVGTRTMVDVVTSQKNLFQAQTTLATDQYSYILAILQLKYQAGTLSVDDLQEINTWLQTKRSYGPELKAKVTRHVNKS